MIVLKKFFTRQGLLKTKAGNLNDDGKDEDCSQDTNSHDNESRKEKGKRRKRKPKAKPTRLSSERTLNSSASNEETAQCSGTLNEQIIEKYVAAVNAHSPADDLIAFYASDKVQVKFDDMAPITARALQTEIVSLTKSFKDFRFNYDSIKEVEPGKVMVEDLCVTGTHNGQPYKFAVYPPITATGKHVVLDPERIWYTMKDGKIVHEVVTALGLLTGPAGFYLAIGGKLG
ncbi:expressed unknown protein [Seminavis robusta]|uniref:SnoaL-like domain-containing protein n=1 Tax=Seminavis robusta TaxID=568900 RepID=A0A9N8DU26_9STRA|nr:expressed unknown protein [Seminavis robusta]|eukprot:Sro290_g109390.1 n/a (230) ;mRNA; r:61057-61746